MIPIGDSPDQPRRRFPFVVLLLIAANLLAFLFELSLGPVLPRFLESFGTVPAAITTGEPATTAAPEPVYLTLLTSMFLHGGFLHFAGNMLFLWVFGDNVEDAMGHLGFLGFYLLCGLAASMAHILSDPLSQLPAIGASGAIAGVLAAYLILFPGATVRTLLFLGPFITITRVSAVFMIGAWALIQLASGLVELTASTAGGSGVAFWAHIGGFVAGLVVTAAWRVLARDQGLGARG